MLDDGEDRDDPETDGLDESDDDDDFDLAIEDDDSDDDPGDEGFVEDPVTT